MSDEQKNVDDGKRWQVDLVLCQDLVQVKMRFSPF